MSIATPNVIVMTTVFGYVYVNNVAVVGATVRFRSPPFIAYDNHITIDVEVVTDSDGRYQASLPETTNTGTIVSVTVEDQNGKPIIEHRKAIIVPDSGGPYSVQSILAKPQGAAVITGGPQGPPGPAGSLADQLVADDTNPTEIELLSLSVTGRFVLVYTDPAGSINEGTMYMYDADSGAAKNAPYIMNTGDAGTTRWIAVSGKYKQIPAQLSTGKEMFFSASNNGSNIGRYASHSIGTNGSEYFTFSIPSDFSSLISLEIECISTFTNTGRNIDLLSNYAMVGEPYNQNVESDTTSTYNFVTNEITSIDVSGVFTTLAADHICGLELDHNAIGGTVHYLGIRLRYN